MSVVISVAEPCRRQGVAEGGVKEWVGRRRREAGGWKLNKIKAKGHLFHVVSPLSYSTPRQKHSYLSYHNQMERSGNGQSKKKTKAVGMSLYREIYETSENK